MSLEEKREEIKTQVINLLNEGHTATMEEVWLGGEIIGVVLHHYSQCRKCVEEREAASGEERKV